MVEIIDIPLESLRQQVEFIMWVRKTHPSTYNRLTKAYRNSTLNQLDVVME